MTKFCIAPWSSIAVKNDGKIKPCCACRGHMGDLTKGDTLDQAWHSPAMVALREKFLGGEQPHECRLCWEMEAASNNSRRLQLNEKLEGTVNPLHFSFANPPFEPSHFDVNFSMIDMDKSEEEPG